MPDLSGGMFSGLYYVATGKLPMDELEEDEEGNMPAFDEGGNTGASYQSGWEAFAGLFSKKRRGKPQGQPEGGGTPNADPEDGAIGGDPSQGYYNTTPPSGGEPPMSTTGKSYYEHNYLTGESTDPRDAGSGDPSTPNA